jgi:hypothetical protein
MPFAEKQVNDLARLTSWNPQNGREIRPSWHRLTDKIPKKMGESTLRASIPPRLGSAS